MSAALYLLTILAVARPLESGSHPRTLEVDGRTRTYLVHVPRGHDGSKALPVVLALPGATSSAEAMERFCGLSEKADAAGFLVVYPEGVGKTFNAGNCCGQAARLKVDDVAFIRAVLDDLPKVARIDSRRVYATGMSNGAIMCYRLASELSERIAAIAPVAGPMGTEKCTPKRPVSVLHFHGSADDRAPFKGGKATAGLSKLFPTDFYSVDHSVKSWIEANGCKREPVVEKLPARGAKDDPTSIVRKTYGGGKDGSEVVLVIIEGGGHAWPGKKVPPIFDLGKSTTHISANDMIWDFFVKHPMK
jgi:polyhydroxybutyrate depolymerase